MTNALVQAVRTMSDRRHFIGRVAATTAAVVGSGLGMRMPARAQGFESRRLTTMVPARGAKPWGISSYRIYHADRVTTTRTEVTLVSPDGAKAGSFVSDKEYLQTYLAEHDRYVRHRTRQVETLVWQTETVTVEAENLKSGDGGRFDVTYNGAAVGSAIARASGGSMEPQLKALVDLRADLFRLFGAIGEDLLPALQVPRSVQARAGSSGGVVHAQEEPPLICTCPWAVVCDGGASCGATAWVRHEACLEAEMCTHDECGWNAWCVGCCTILGCSCACAGGTDFACWCVVTGKRCSCQQVPWCQ